MTLRNSLLAASAIVFSLFGGTTTAQAELLEGLIVYYDFETDLSNKAPEFIGVYNAATVGTINPTTFTPGWTGAGSRSTLLAGNALNIVDIENAASNFIRAPIGSGNAAPDGANLLGNFSISAWHYLDPTIDGNERFFVFESSAGFDISWGTQPNNSTLFWAYNSEAQVGAPKVNGISTDAWHHVVHTFTLEGANVILDVYVDGAHVGDSFSQPHSTASFSFAAINFGNARNGQDRVWDGMLDEIAIWDRPLTADEVGIVYATGRAGQSLLNPVPEPSTWVLGGIAVAWSLVMVRRRAKRS